MNFCKTCGAQLEDGAEFCTGCGARVEATPEFSYTTDNNQTMSTPVASVTAIPEGPRKKNKGLLFTAAALLLVVVVGGVILFTNRGDSNNKAASADPDSYLKGILKDNTKEVIPSFVEGYSQALTSLSGSQMTTTNALDASGKGYVSVKYEPSDVVNSLLELYAPISLTDVSADIDYVMENDQMALLLSLSMNGNKLLSADAFYDLASMLAFVKFPELSSSYLKVDMNSDVYTDMLGGMTSNSLGVDTSSLDGIPDAKDIEKLLNIISDNAFDMLDKNVVLTKNVSVTANGVSCTYDQFTATITEGTLYDACIAVLDEISKEPSLLASIDSLLAEEGTSIAAATKELKSSIINKNAEIMKYTVYLDKDETIKGQECVVIDDSSNVSCAYLSAVNGNDTGFYFWVKDETNTEIVSIVGKYNGNDKAKKGELTASISTADYYGDYITYDCTIGFDIAEKDSTFTITSSQLPGSNLGLSCQTQGTKSTASITATYQGMNLGKLTFAFDENTSATIEPFDSSANVYDIIDEYAMNDYISEVDIEALLYDLSNKIGIDLSSLMGMIY